MSTGAVVALVIVLGLLGLLLLSVVALQFLGDDATSSFSSTGQAIGTDDGGDDGATDSSDVDVPEGFAIIEGYGTSIAAPDTWQEMSPRDFDMTPEQLSEAFPDAPYEMLEQAAGFFDQGGSLVAFEPSFDFASNVSVASYEGETPTYLSRIAQQARTRLLLLEATIESNERITVPMGEAQRVQYTVDVAGPDGTSTSAEGVEYYIPHEGRVYVITVTTDEGVAELADTMIETFRVG
jgi:hypothetical protein